MSIDVLGISECFGGRTTGTSWYNR